MTNIYNLSFSDIYNKLIRKNKIVVIIIIIIISIILYIFLKNKKENYDNIEYTNDIDNVIDNLIDDENKQSDADEQLDIKWSNKSPNNIYKSSSYLDGIRGNDDTTLNALDSYDSQLAETIDYSKMNTNDEFEPLDETKGQFSSYKLNKKNFTTNELMNSDKLLPQEVNKDWFESVPEPIKVKNRHLININKPIGIDTIGSSMKIANRDIRGNIPAPKFVVSPWLNSQIEPDLSNIGFCNKNE